MSGSRAGNATADDGRDVVPCRVSIGQPAAVRRLTHSHRMMTPWPLENIDNFYRTFDLYLDN